MKREREEENPNIGFPYPNSRNPMPKPKPSNTKPIEPDRVPSLADLGTQRGIHGLRESNIPISLKMLVEMLT